MPLTILETYPSKTENLCERRLRRGSLRDRGRRLTIALVNNMPDSALLATQRQFARLLEDGAGEFDLALTLWTLESVPRAEETRREIAGQYRAAKGLRNLLPDAIIMTGAEPIAADLEDEPYWREMTGLIDWARGRTVSLMASCLAAHVVTQYQDGVRRRRLAQKRSGVYSVETAARHALTQGMPPVVTVPHSRWNDLDESELVAKNYQVLRRSTEAGVDLFVKDFGHLQVFLQGHPEYESDTLAREYRRDVLRSLRAKAPAPALPAHYFSDDVADSLRNFVANAALHPQAADFPSQALQHDEAPWRAPNATMFNNWLSMICARKAAASPTSCVRARSGG